MSRNHFWMTVGAEEVTDLKVDRSTGEFRERFLFASNKLKKRVKDGTVQDFPWASQVEPNGRMPMIVKTMHIVPKGRDKKWYQDRAKALASAMGTTPQFNWGIQAPKEARQPIPNVVVDKVARKEARRAARNEPQADTHGGSPAAYARYRVRKATNAT